LGQGIAKGEWSAFFLNDFKPTIEIIIQNLSDVILGVSSTLDLAFIHDNSDDFGLHFLKLTFLSS
jgi:hypothetical protein